MEKRTYKSLLDKQVVTKEGKKLGISKDLTFETRTGEIIYLILKNLTSYSLGLSLEKTKDKEALIPFNSVIAIGDFIVISEEDLI